MAFERLQNLGEEKFGKILNLLMRGESAQSVARMIQQAPPTGWGLFQDVGELTLRQQVNRLRGAAARGMFGLKSARRIEAGAMPQIKMLEHVSIRVIERLEELADLQRTRVHDLVAKEKLDTKPVGYGTTNEVMEGYRKTLLDIQKLRFDMGLDEFKGPLGVSQSGLLRGASQITTLPNGTTVQNQVFEAVNVVEQILNAHNIPQLSAHE